MPVQHTYEGCEPTSSVLGCDKCEAFEAGRAERAAEVADLLRSLAFYIESNPRESLDMVQHLTLR